MWRGEAVKVGRKKANIYSEARRIEQGQLQRHSPLQQLCNYVQSLHQHRQSHNLHARAGPEDLGQLEKGI